MQFNFIDIMMLIILLLGAFKGWKDGGVTSAINLVGTILVFVLSYFLKNPLSTYMYQHWPFISFGGIFQGIAVFNILFYEALAYVACVVVLSILLKVVLKLTGIVDKILEKSVILRTPSKIAGLVCSLLQAYICVYIVLFIMAQIPASAEFNHESFSADFIVSKTPILSNITNSLYNAASEVYEICVEHQTDDDKTNANLLSLSVLLKYNIVSLDDVNYLLDNKKLKINGIDEFISEWEEFGEYVIDEKYSGYVQEQIDKTIEGVNTITGGGTNND